MLCLQSITRRPFHAALFDASSAIGQAGGWVTDHQLYSDLMAVVRFEVPPDGVSTLIAALGQSEIKVTEVEEKRRMRRPAGDTAEVAGQLTISFAQATGDVRRMVPGFD